MNREDAGGARGECRRAGALGEKSHCGGMKGQMKKAGGGRGGEGDGWRG